MSPALAALGAPMTSALNAPVGLLNSLSMLWRLADGASAVSMKAGTCLGVLGTEGVGGAAVLSASAEVGAAPGAFALSSSLNSRSFPGAGSILTRSTGLCTCRKRWQGSARSSNIEKALQASQKRYILCVSTCGRCKACLQQQKACAVVVQPGAGAVAASMQQLYQKAMVLLLDLCA
eukprot:7769-Heterococcus_DN1.PRE.3